MTQLLQNAVYGTVLILAVAVLRGALKDRLLPEARLALWAVCLFRLFTPVAPTSALSFWGLFGRETRELPVSVPAAGPVAAPNAGSMAPTATVGTAAGTPAVPAEAGVPWGTILAAVWIAVGLILAARYMLAYMRTRRAVGRAIPLGREDTRYAALPKCARLREGPMDGAPLTFGAVRPTVVLPPGLEGAELACVLAHEGVHARRRDNLWHYAAAAALTVFWWDPAVWLMARLVRRDVELSCDRAAVRRLGADRRAEYANALVTLSTQAEGGAFCHGFGPKRTEERIISIMKYKKTTVVGAALTLALVLAVTVGFASDPAADMPDEDAVTYPVYDDMGPSGQFVDADETEDDFVCYDPTSDPDVILREYKAVLDRAVARGERTQAEANEMLANMEVLIERAKNGEIKGLMFNRRASGEVCFVEDLDRTDADDQDGIYICIREDCPYQPAAHFHDADGEAVSVYTSADVLEHKDMLNRAIAQKEAELRAHWEVLTEPEKEDGMSVCTRKDCPIQPPIHFHDEDGKIFVYNGTAFVHAEIGDYDDQGGLLVNAEIRNYHEGEPIGCPPEAIDADFYQNYPEANYRDFDHHESESGHHSDSHH